MKTAGGIPGGLIGRAKNDYSKKRYVVSTAPEINQDYWSTVVFPVIVSRVFFGLVKKSIPNIYEKIASFIRNNKEDAHQVHAEVLNIVNTIPEDDWINNFPSFLPSDGISEGAKEKMKDQLGDNPIM